MDALPLPERRFLGDTGSLKSFRQNGSASAPPSLKTTSLRSRTPAILKLPTLVRRRRAQSGDFDGGGIKDRNFNTPSQEHLPPKLEETNMAGGSYEGIENNTCIGKKTDTTPRKPTRSKTIMRLISTKFRVRSPPTMPTPPLPIPRSPAQITSVFGSKETREAALRERGLLPPLKPSADLSMAECERDARLPVLTSPSNEEVLTANGEERKVSAALKVKQEWEAKHVGEREELARMKSFTFGRPLSPPASTPLPPSVIVEPVEGAHHQAPALEQDITPTLSIRTKRSLPALRLGDPALQRRSSFEAHLIPLPPSPSPSAQSPRSREELAAISLAASFPLPPSVGLDIPQSSPTISLTLSVTPSFAPLEHTRTESATSHLTAVSDIASAMSVSSVDEPSAIPQSVVPVIVESPDEEAFPEEVSLLKGSITGQAHEHIIVEAALSNDNGDKSDIPEAAYGPKPRIRNFTDPGLKPHKPERRKSFNPFKRSQVHSPDPIVVSPPNTPTPRRSSMGTSLNNMRRSVAGTLSRPRATGPGAKVEHGGFDASHLPPSPTIPAVFADQAGASSPIASPKWPSPFLQQQQQRPAHIIVKARIPVSPTLYSPGTIVAATNNIEDDESRRMTELAFLG